MNKKNNKELLQKGIRYMLEQTNHNGKYWMYTKVTRVTWHNKAPEEHNLFFFRVNFVRGALSDSLILAGSYKKVRNSSDVISTSVCPL
ncbi:hypothetical protein T02_11994 [Trichinella nativa]|uniref:Uncharacterized protein n=1 Tax=Trichinella nativa TaxID=6335 RepID=A0A0V1KMU6_9BILA|nr:hypothetical protein T02_11994 [Trichinella nativa]